MTSPIEIRHERSRVGKGRSALNTFTAHILEHCLQQTGQAGAHLSIMYCGDEAIRRLNHRFRGIDKATDVLSFPSYEPDESQGGSHSYDFGEDETPHFGDLAISLPTVFREAAEQGKDPVDHIALMLIHGYLHLLGYDHDTPDREARMWAETDRLLTVLDSIDKPLVLLDDWEGAAAS
ncbi:MAG: rRNA maturation RNase YbeY [Sumerlaeia bacterium]